MAALLRPARLDDIPHLHRIRHAVRENVLVSAAIGPAEYVASLQEWGRGWVVEEDGAVVGFAIGDRRDGNIWAVFVDPVHEGRGHGRRLLEAVVGWLFAEGLQRLWLSTEPGTRAERLYTAAGWRRVGTTARGEVEFELLQTPRRPPWLGRDR